MEEKIVDKKSAVQDGADSSTKTNEVLTVVAKLLVLVVLVGISLSLPSPADVSLHHVQVPPTPGETCSTTMSATRHTLALSPLEEEVLTPLEPFIMLSGLPGAETRLMRALLDDHPQVRCGESLGVIHNMVRLWRTFTAPAERQRLQLAGISQMVVMEAAQLFLLDVLANNGPSASRLCTRDVLALTGGVFLKTLFPNVKFIFLVRDTRAAATHLVHRQVPVMGRRLRSVEEGLRMLEDLLMLLRRECRMLGPHHCLPVHYEALVLNPRKTLERVLEFLEVEWDEAVLHHHLHTGVFVSRTARGSSTWTPSPPGLFTSQTT
ncbi:hypothetical protein OTU49_003954 [Cherax quadricarinatus]|uniref:Protein-tyrosine sulfotransferase n=3 Tax=Cherax quadricarinatus TaxID=27406 RepID=A0AAW0XFU5_CHEQU